MISTKYGVEGFEWYPSTQMVLVDCVFGDTSAKGEENFLLISYLKLVMGLPYFPPLIVSTKGVPSLFDLAINIDASVDDHCEHVSRSHVGSPNFVRNAFINELILVSFLSKLNEIIVHDSPHDSVNRDLNSNGIFSTKSFYMELVSLASSHI